MLSPGGKGWIKKYFSILENYEEQLNKFPGSMSGEELIYAYLQPTGIMYGYPTRMLFMKDEYVTSWTKEESFKVLLLEGLILVDHVYKGKFDHESLENSLEEFVHFYEETEIEKAKKSWLNFKGQDTYQKLESILAQRVDLKASLSHALWTSYLYNSLIYQDIILYHQYHLGADVAALTEKRRLIILDMIRVIAAAAHADGDIEDEEEAIYEVFMASADLEGDDFSYAVDFWEQGKGLDDIEFGYEMTWLLKRYILELAILTVWSDRKVVEAEHLFLDRLSEKLGIDEDEKDRSFLAIQTFVMKNHESVPFLKGQNDAELLMSGAAERWKKILGRNKDKLARELRQSKDLVALIAKSTTSDLTAEEKERVKVQMKDLAKTVPSLTLFMLPGGSLLLPIILKIIPDLVPSAFRDNQIEEDKEKEE